MASKKVLLVDDELLIRYSLAQVLQQEGVVVREAASAEEALEAIEDAFYDLCFLDIKLPGMDGLEAMEAIRRQCPGTKVVLMSAHCPPDQECVARAEGFLEKPFDLQRVREIADFALNGRGPACTS